MPGISHKLARELDLGRSSGREVIRSVDELQSYPDAHALRRGWEKIGLDAIVCVDQKPTVYLKEVDQIRRPDIRRYQRFVWNQGVATVLVICTPDTIHVYSGMARPADVDEEPTAAHRLIKTLDRVADALEIQRLIRWIETGQIYRDTPESFDPESAVDQYLLRNLCATAERLREVDPKVPYATICALLGRVIFTCYLTDRKIIDEKQFRGAGSPGVCNLRELFKRPSSQSCKQLYSLFDHLQPQFNGSMFGEDLAEERRGVSAKHIEVLSAFLQGHDLGTGQQALGFWAYDFNFIPIETISAIYEDFLGLQDAEKANRKRKIGAYYTPKHLVELIVDMGTESWRSLLGRRFLDPACGSGVFLVTLFNRIAEEWRRANPTKLSPTRWRALRRVLTGCLFGVDRDEIACRLTCFSLYLALLDHFNPRDVQELAAKGRLLPNLLLREGESAPPDEPRTILCRNFFDEDVPLPSDGFDLVTGNPPWVGRNQPRDKKAETWYRQHVEQKLPSGQIVHAFMWKASAHAHDRGHVCLLLPSKVFLNRTDEFQERWLAEHEMQRVLQLADWSFLLFENAACPAVGVRYSKDNGEKDRQTIDYLTPQASRIDPRRGTIPIAPEDHKKVALDELLYHARAKEAPLVWKMYMRGTPRDIRLLDRLSGLPSLADVVSRASPQQPERWRISQGFKPGRDARKANSPWWDRAHLFVDARKPEVDFILERETCEPVGDRFQELHRLPDRVFFRGPMVLINQGFSKFAYADFDVLFRHSLQAISGPEAAKDRLVFLCMILRSRLARYFMFHTAANWGTERDKVLEYELLRLPFALPESLSDSDKGLQIARELVNIFRSAQNAIHKSVGIANRQEIVREHTSQIEPLVYDYYDLDEWERILVDDTATIIEPSATPHTLDADVPTWRPASGEERGQYSETICRVLNEWTRRSGYRVHAETVASPATGLGVVSLNRSSSSRRSSDREAEDELRQSLGRIRGLLPNRNSWRTYMRGLTVFDGDWIHMVKPLTLRHWTRTAALNDADELAAAILTPRQGLPR